MKRDAKSTVRPRRKAAVAAESSVAYLRNRRGEAIKPSSIRATDVKNEFGRILDRVMGGEAIVITKHDLPKAVLLSVEDFNSLVAAEERKIDTLTAEFDDLLAQMQTPKARAAVDALFRATPKQLGRAAIRKRG